VTDPPHHRVAIIGAGFSGIGMAARLLKEGIDDFVVLERADEVGGTWRDNTYPGCQAAPSGTTANGCGSSRRPRVRSPRTS
jgi:cation diffusion facilitator CzcD-associated flavoprotein CzcO